MAIPDTYKTMPPELLKIMLEMSGSEDEKEKLVAQLALANKLSSKAIDSSGAPGSSRLGGLAHVGSKIILGYKGGKDQLESEKKMEELKTRNIAGREKYMKELMEAIYGRNQGSGPTSFGGGLGGGLDIGNIGSNDPYRPEEYPYDPMQPPI